MVGFLLRRFGGFPGGSRYARGRAPRLTTCISACRHASAWASHAAVHKAAKGAAKVPAARRQSAADTQALAGAGIREGVLRALRPVYLLADTLPLGHRTQRYLRLQRAQPKYRRLADSLQQTHRSWREQVCGRRAPRLETGQSAADTQVLAGAGIL